MPFNKHFVTLKNKSKALLADVPRWVSAQKGAAVKGVAFSASTLKEKMPTKKAPQPATPQQEDVNEKE